MYRYFLSTWLIAGTLSVTTATLADDAAAPTASAPASGSPSVIVNGRPAQRLGDQTSAGASTPEISPNVFINGKPAVTGGGCPDGVPVTSPNVFINGRPAVIGCTK